MTKKNRLLYALACAGLSFVLLLLYFAVTLFPYFRDVLMRKEKEVPYVFESSPVMVLLTEEEGEQTLSPLPTSRLIENVPIMGQKPDFPTGCETISAVMALRYFGVEIAAADFIDQYLETSRNFYTENGVLYGPDPYETFVGSPRDSTSFGCMSPVIENAMKKCVGDRGTVLRLEGKELETLCKTYILRDKPVLIWATINMLDTYPTASWHLSDGSKFTWPANEHCLLLVGFTETHYIFNDPWEGTRVSYPKSLVEKRFEQLGMQAIVLY